VTGRGLPAGTWATDPYQSHNQRMRGEAFLFCAGVGDSVCC
jgi:hypothetical protein